MTSIITPRQVGHNIDCRPSSALARGVHIREEQSAKINPSPLLTDEQLASYLLEDYLSPRKLRDLTGVDNLDDVTMLELRVDTIDTSLGNFGVHLPNLLQLKLSDSNISSLRDLGSCLAKLRVLWMSRCGLEDVQGIGSMSNLRELYVSYNDITDVTPCGMLESLEILDLEGNCISDMNQIGTLAWCPKLYSLTLGGNPICASSEINDSSTEYREAVQSLIPHLRILDDEPLPLTTPGSTSDNASNSARPSSTTKVGASAFDSDWKLLAELMEDGTFTGNETVLDFVAPGRPGTAGRPLTSTYRPGTALRPYTALKSRPGSCPGNSRPATSRPATSRSADALSRKSTPSDEGISEDGSELTSGAVLCGNPCKALSRRQAGKLSSSSKLARMMVAQARERASQAPANSVVIDEQLANEIQRFKVDHEKRMSEISATKTGPQVLVVNYDDAVSISDGEEDLSEEISSDEGLPSGSFEQRYRHGDVDRDSLTSSEAQQNSPLSSAEQRVNSSNGNIHADSAFFDGVSDSSLQFGGSLNDYAPRPPSAPRASETLRRASRDSLGRSDKSDKLPNAAEAESAPVIIGRSTSRTPDSPEGNVSVPSSSALKSKLHKVGNVTLLPSKYPSRPL